MKRGASIIFATLATTVFVWSAAAQSGGGFELTGNTVDGGGGTSTGDGFVLNGTIGQPDAGSMSGSGFTLSGGFRAGGVTAPAFPTIPTVSEWGLIVMTLLLLIGAKIYFARWRVARAAT